MPKIAAAAAFTLALLVPAISWAQPTNRPAPAAAPVPERTTASYGDWTLTCFRRPPDAPAGTPARACEIVLPLRDARGQPSGQIALGRPSASEPARFVMIVPLSVSVSIAPQLQPSADRAAEGTISLAWRACGTGGCVAETTLDDAALTRLRAREVPGQLAWQNAAGQAIAAPFSFRGLSPALDALAAAMR